MNGPDYGDILTSIPEILAVSAAEVLDDKTVKQALKFGSVVMLVGGVLFGCAVVMRKILQDAPRPTNVHVL